jgi:putative membrane protein
MDYNFLKSLHIIFVVSWFAGLFYLPRLLVYHVEAQDKDEQAKEILSKQFEKMEKLLFNAIMIPAMWLTWLTGLSMVYITWWDNFQAHTWLHLKLAFVVGITIYHFICRHFIRKFHNAEFILTSSQLRLFNEIATILLVAVVFLVIAKNTFDMLMGMGGFIIFAIVIMAAVTIVKKIRSNA